MELWYRLAADALVVVHFSYASYVVVALLLTLLGIWRGWAWVRNPWFRYIHMAMIGIVVIESWLGIPCPLTVWEQQLRGLAGQQTYQGEFIATFVHDALFWEFPAWGFTVMYTAFGAAVALTFLLAPPHRRAELGVDG